MEIGQARDKAFEDINRQVEAINSMRHVIKQKARRPPRWAQAIQQIQWQVLNFP